MPSISEGKTCQTTNDSGQIESYYKKEFWWDNIHLDPMNSMFTNTGMAASENGNKRILLYLGAARRILEVYTWPSSCSVVKCKFTNNQLTNNNVHSASSFSTSNLTASPSYASGFKIECSSQIMQIRITFTDLDLTHTVFPRMSIPVTNAVKVWDSYCKTSVNKGSASRAYLVGNDPPEGNDSKHHLYNDRDFNGIRCDSIGGFHRYSNNAQDPAYIAVFFGFRIRVCNFFVSMPDKAPANLTLYMDGKEIAKVTSDAPDKISDLLDWYTRTEDPNDLVGSSFKLVWPTTYSGGSWTIAHCTRITISYTETGCPIRQWKSTLMNKYDYSTTWWAHQTEHPSVQNQTWDHPAAKTYTENTLCTAGTRWKPLDGAYAGYGTFSSDYDTEFAQRSGALFFTSSQDEINLTAFIINFPDFGEAVDSNDTVTKYRTRSRNSGMKLIAQAGGFETERVIAEFGKGQIAANRLNLLDYRKTNYLSRIKSLKLLLEIKETGDSYENVINSVDIFFYINEFTPQKVWESTHRLNNSPVALPSYIGVKDEAMLTVQDTNRTHGHTKQMMTEGFPHYWKTGDSTNRRINIEFNGVIVMTSFIFETCRTYRRNNYRNVKLECYDNSYETICETPETVGSKNGKDSEENWCPGDYIEMFDHKKMKHMPFITGKKFRLSFPNTGNVAVGKISVGYYDVNDESRDSKWVPGDFNSARIIHPDPTQNDMQKLNSNPFSCWETNTTNNLQLKFQEKVKIKNVILGLKIKSSGSNFYPVPELDDYGRSQPNLDDNKIYQNIKLKIDNTQVAYTNNSFIPGNNQTHIHFFQYTDNENGISDSHVYRNNVNFYNGTYDGQNIKLQWDNNSGGYHMCRLATLEIIYSKIVPSDLVLAERACLAAHNSYRFRHGLSIDYNYSLAYTNGTADSLMTSARDYATTLLGNGKFEHSANAISGNYGENLFRIQWKDTNPSEFDKLAVAGEAVQQWYSEYVNYDTSDGQRNGNILHEGQIEHFLQVICKGSTTDGKIGIGIKSSGSTTIVCVHYEKMMTSSGKTANYIKRPSYVGAISLLTIQEEAKLREVIAQGKADLSGMTQTQKNKLFKTCKYYLKAAQEKLDYLKDEAQDQFTDIIENGYSKSEWTNELTRIENLVTSAKTRQVGQISNLTADISSIRIPNSLAETSFRDLQLTGFFLDLIDVLGVSCTISGSTRSSAIIASQTLNAMITANDGALDQNGFADASIDYHDCKTDNEPGVKKCIRVMLGLFGVQTNTASTDHWYSDDTKFENAWKKIARRLFWIFADRKAVAAVLIEYNGFRGDGVEMTESYASDCPKETHTSQAYSVQFDHCTD